MKAGDHGLLYAFRCAPAEFNAMAAHVRDLREALETTYPELQKDEQPQCEWEYFLQIDRASAASLEK
jgi:hypothetical protein